MLLSYQDDEERKLIQKILEKKKSHRRAYVVGATRKETIKQELKKKIMTRDKIGQSPGIDMIRVVATYYQIRKWLSFCSIACYNRSG